MDLQTAFLCLTICVVSALVIYGIIVSTMKEKTYDEAMADRRKKTEEQYGTTKSTKDKSKDKKLKKAGKKVKEKAASEQQSAANVSDNEQGKPQHVVFAEEPQVNILTEDPVLVSEDKEKKKPKKKEKPILLNKNEPTLLADNPPPVQNHFEKIHPKDDLELKRSHSHEEVHKESAPVKEQPAQKQAKSKASAAPKQQQPETQPKPEKKAQQPSVKSTNPPAAEKTKTAAANPDKKEQTSSKLTAKPAQATAVAILPAQETVSAPAIVQSGSPTVKPNKKKKSELTVLQQMSSDKEGVNVNLLIPLVRKAEMSRSEIQLLIDTLLNKQSDSTDISSEWIEGRQDPVMKLKKQLADKERDLTEEQEKTLGLHNRLKELRTELNGEKHQVRALEGALQARQAELAAVAAKLQHAADEKQAHAQQLQQLQSKLGEERRVIMKLQEESGQAQGAFQTELLARQQTELVVATLNEQIRQQLETIAALEAQMNGQLQEREGLTSELNMLRQERSSHLQDSAAQAQDLIRQIEELRQVQAKMSIVMGNSHMENTKLANEVAELKEQLSLSSSENEKLNAALQNIQAENKRLTQQVCSASVEATQLRSEKESLAAQVTASMERPATEGRENGDSNNYNESKHARIEDQDSLQNNKDLLLEMKGQLKSKELTIDSLTSELQTYKTEVTEQQTVLKNLKEEVNTHKQEAERLSAELLQQKSQISSLNEKLQSQITKNNGVAEKMLQEQQSSTRKLLLRIFPEMNVPEIKDQNKWLDELESAVSEWKSKQTPAEQPADLADLEKQNAQLQAMVSHYKKIIADTEGMLNRLQSHVEEEEGKWGEEMETLQCQLETVTRERDALQASSGAHQNKTANGYCLIDTASQTSSKRRSFTGWLRKRVGLKKRNSKT
ncbi:flagellar attachment zone protein 1 isoform X5 [Nilaparvata lugens]|uniref:flagellar attachment zone protein 1 isoform X5 n=1 Tax=Nilaparvata lugens TaxID=108931 RepID=UPI00193D490E|nr:flagellar attachment zone protein 1 isoform X5 [Nilaparvata lugens]